MTLTERARLLHSRVYQKNMRFGRRLTLPSNPLRTHVLIIKISAFRQ